MRTRFTLILGVAVLISVAALVACSSKYSNTNNGLVVVSTQGNAVMDTFSLDLGNGHITWIFNSDGPPTAGQPTAVVLDPSGNYAYVIVTKSTNVNASVTGIETFSVASDGKLGPIKTTGLNNVGTAPAAPVAMVIDSAGKFLFVADSATGTESGAISVLSVGSGGALTEVAGSPFVLPAEPGGTTPNPSALAITPTVYPVAYSFCSGSVPPTTENLYVTDSLNYTLINYSVSSSGALKVVPTASAAPSVATGRTPLGVTVDPCNRFAYVSNWLDNSVSAYTICNVVSLPTCAKGDFSLLPVTGSPFITGQGPGPLLEDALANFLYVLNTGQNEISAYRISTTTGSLSPLSPATIATNSYPTSMAIRSDDSWLFVTNLTQANLSQYAITPSSGGLTPQTPVQTDNFPWGIAVK
jgi:6-phosphogluconolactonase (cycloisomerase 2 family)